MPLPMYSKATISCSLFVCFCGVAIIPMLDTKEIPIRWPENDDEHIPSCTAALLANLEDTEQTENISSATTGREAVIKVG